MTTSLEKKPLMSDSQDTATYLSYNMQKSKVEFKHEELILSRVKLVCSSSCY